MSPIDPIPAGSAGSSRSSAAIRTDSPTWARPGGISDVVRAEVAEQFCDGVPKARHVDVADAGHMVAGDRNEHFLDAAVPFLDKVA
ncbi:hypothetical protein KPP03845_100209 [Streptomyces xanthophaeus]|uniref:alpha/beta fold hydrolase n=1 Tax=Streptomyces xanthophaeus TaxID=67385 RepID=UPI00233F0F0F|nr:hypothetical protein [Streptomyces xanthophaeus]WCD83890.1 hypothetical protein KPP03845_100209 [Streptomyces xanthophaeus]